MGLAESISDWKVREKGGDIKVLSKSIRTLFSCISLTLYQKSSKNFKSLQQITEINTLKSLLDSIEYQNQSMTTQWQQAVSHWSLSTLK